MALGGPLYNRKSLWESCAHLEQEGGKMNFSTLL